MDWKINKKTLQVEDATHQESTPTGITSERVWSQLIANTDQWPIIIDKHRIPEHRSILTWEIVPEHVTAMVRSTPAFEAIKDAIR